MLVTVAAVMQVGSRPRHSRQRSGRNRFRWCRMLATLRPRAGSDRSLTRLTIAVVPLGVDARTVE